jgi:hypothetical protein
MQSSIFTFENGCNSEHSSLRVSSAEELPADQSLLEARASQVSPVFVMPPEVGKGYVCWTTQI